MSKATIDLSDAAPRLLDYGPVLPSTASRRISMTGRGSFRGRISHGGRLLLFESLLEYECALILLADKRVSHLEDQPPRIEYVDWAGKPHTHTFDFRATLTDGSRYAVIVKPAEKADRPEARLVFSAIARDLPEKFAEAVVIVTERELSPAKVADARLVLNARDIVDEAADTKLLEVLGRLSGSVTIATLRDAVGLGGRGFGAIVRAIDKGLILVTGRERAPPSLARTRRDGRIDEASLVARA